jgi:hypothetical protein
MKKSMPAPAMSRPMPAAIVKPGSGMSKLGPNTTTNQTQASVQAPSPTLAGAELSTEMYTFIARPVTDGRFVVLYNGDRQFAQIVLTLETAGPVAVSRSQQLDPVLSGKGQTLETGVPLSFFVAKGNRIYVAATSISRIKVTIQPLPWLEQFAGLLGLIYSKR